MFRSLIFASILAVTASQNTTYPRCSVCGDGSAVGNPDFIFSYPGEPNVTCATLQSAGELGLITADNCTALPALIGVCGCEVVAPAAAPVTPVAPTTDPCSVCGKGFAVGNPDFIFSYPGEPNVTCATLQSAGELGLISPENCTALPTLIGVCGCEAIAPAAAPVAPVAPTPTPCSVCGEGFAVGNPDFIFSYPGEPNVTCATLQSAGELGLISPENCTALPTLIGVCGCEATAPAAAPVAPVAPTPTPCSVCGEGFAVGNPDFIFSYPGEPNVTCATLQSAGELGLISPENCTALSTLIGVCGCEAIAPAAAPVAPVAPTTAPPCSVCGEGFAVGNPDFIFSYPGEPNVTCSTLQSAGEQGLISPENCTSLPPLIGVCGCENVTEGVSPVAPVASPIAVTMAPVVPTEAPATSAPIVSPTEAPVPPPTTAPIVSPTEAPVPPPTTAPMSLPPTLAPTTLPPTPSPTLMPILPPTPMPVIPPTPAPVVTVPIAMPFATSAPKSMMGKSRGGKSMMGK